MATFRHNNNEGEVRPSDDECLVRRRSASVLEVKEHAQDRLRDELLKAQSVSHKPYFESIMIFYRLLSQRYFSAKFTACLHHKKYCRNSC